MSYSQEQVEELLSRTDALLNQVLPQARHLVLDIGNTNELCNLITKMKQEKPSEKISHT
jgi:hypothetical protein